MGPLLLLRLSQTVVEHLLVIGTVPFYFKYVHLILIPILLNVVLTSYSSYKYHQCIIQITQKVV